MMLKLFRRLPDGKEYIRKKCMISVNISMTACINCFVCFTTSSYNINVIVLMVFTIGK